MQELAKRLLTDGTVRLSGNIVVSDVLHIGPRTRVVADYPCTIEYRGPRTDKPLLTVMGVDGSDKPHEWDTVSSVHGVRLQCNWLCRGIELLDCRYGQFPVLDCVAVDRPRQLGVRAIDCWCGDVSHVAINECRGVAIEMSRCNSVSWRNVRIKYNYLLWRGTNMQPLWEFANMHTIEETRKEFADTICEDFPGHIAESDRACIVIHKDQDLTDFDNLVMEPICTGNQPAVFVNSGTTTFRNVRFESGWHGSQSGLFEVRGNGWTRGTNVTIDTAFVTANGMSGAIAKSIGKSHCLSIMNVNAFKQNCRSLVMTDGLGMGIKIDRCRAFSDEDGKIAVPEIVFT